MKVKYIYITTESRLCISGDTGGYIELDIYESHRDTYGVSPDRQNNKLNIVKQNRDKSFSPITYDFPIELLEAIVENKIIYYNHEEAMEIFADEYKERKSKDALRAKRNGGSTIRE